MVAQSKMFVWTR